MIPAWRRLSSSDREEVEMLATQVGEGACDYMDETAAAILSAWQGQGTTKSCTLCGTRSRKIIMPGVSYLFVLACQL
jgi:hypothetical protein